MTTSEDTQKINPRSPQPKKRSAWYLLTGMVLGFALGLMYTWWINPVVYESSDPSSMREDYKDTYRSTIAQVYAVTGNLDRAARRLELLEDESLIYSLGAQAQRALAEGKEELAHDLALLASALQAGSAEPTMIPIATTTATSEAVPTQTLPPLTPVP